MSDKLAEHLGRARRGDESNNAVSRRFDEDQANAIRRDPQAHIDALVEAGVLIRFPLRFARYAYQVIQPPHEHEWRVTCCTNRRGTAETVYVECACGESRTAVPNRLPIEVPE